jgi:glycosyltransferase involved in cell wall biosynthesis
MSQIRSEVLYISLDGIMDPLGYSQVLKYLQYLSNEHKINLITFEKKDNLDNPSALAKAKLDCLSHNICWYKLKYRNGFLGLGQILNILNIIFVPIIIFIKKNISLVHIRSYMPGITIPFLKIFFKFKLIFDIRGFWPDEKHDRLGWDQTSFKYKFFKRLEVYLMVNADCIVALTHASKKIIKKNFRISDSNIEVIPTCVDFNEFKLIKNKEEDELFTIGYLGSTDTAYDFKKFCFLVDQMQVYLDKKINLKVLTSSSFDEIARSCSFKNYDKVKLEVKFVERQSLSHEISSFNLLGFCLKENFSVQASMPTKIGEVLACGIPLICNSFNSDIEKLVNENKVGLTYDFRKQLTNKDLNRIFELIYDPNTSLNCINTAKSYFSLHDGSLKYNRIYSKFA